MDVSRDLRGMGRDEICGSDPLHPKKEVYVNIAPGIIKMAINMGESRRESNEAAKRHRSDSHDASGQQRRRDDKDRNKGGAQMPHNHWQGRPFSLEYGNGGRGLRGGHRP
jgi:hypothetical protein